MSPVAEIDRDELAERFEAKCCRMREVIDDAIILPADHVERWFEVVDEHYFLPPRHRDDLYHVRRRPDQITIIFAKSVRIELVRGARNVWHGYQMPLERDPPPPRLARWRDWIYAYPMDEHDIAETLLSYSCFSEEWDLREQDRRAPAPYAEQVGTKIYTAPGRFDVQTGWVLSVLDVPRRWHPFKRGLFNFRREPLTRDLVRGGWRFVAQDPVEAEKGGVRE